MIEPAGVVATTRRHGPWPTTGVPVAGGGSSSSATSVAGDGSAAGAAAEGAAAAAAGAADGDDGDDGGAAGAGAAMRGLLAAGRVSACGVPRTQRAITNATTIAASAVPPISRPRRHSGSVRIASKRIAIGACGIGGGAGSCTIGGGG